MNRHRQTPAPPPVDVVRGAVEFDHPGPRGGPARCWIHSRTGVTRAWSWLPSGEAPQARVESGYAQLLEHDQPKGDRVLVGLRPLPNVFLRDIISDTLCPVPGVVAETIALIDDMSDDVLRDFLRSVLLRPVVIRAYWTIPGARRAHHAYPGGFAVHNLQMARMVASLTDIPHYERELGIAYALTHDYGKIHCYTVPGAEPTDPRTHEIVGRIQLADDLKALMARDADLGARMAELIGGPRAGRVGAFPLAIGQIVRSFDQMSCEQERRRRGLDHGTAHSPQP